MKPESSQWMKVLAWALWDWGTSAFSAVVTTFVFARYLVSDFFVDPAILEAWQAAGGAAAAARRYLPGSRCPRYGLRLS